MFNKKLVFLFVVSLCLSFFSFADVPVTQTAGAINKLEKDSEKSRLLDQKIKKGKIKSKIEDPVAQVVDAPGAEKVLIKKINIEGATIVAAQEIKDIIKKYENTRLSIRQMQAIADLISDVYRRQGYPTSRAYVPAQTISADGVLVINVVEGKVGNISVKGNKFFKTKIYTKSLKLTPGAYFNYADLQEALTSINEKPDRFVKTVLVPGKTPGSTDIVIDANDRLPIHAGYTYDNYGSRYVGRIRQSFDATHNNLFGFDDQLYYKYQRSRDALSVTQSGRYLFPVNDGLDVGFSASYSKTKLGREFASVRSVGKAMVLGLFLNQALISTVNLDLRLNLGFDYKKIRNSLLGVETTRDDGRVVKGGFDIDYTDSFGRTLFLAEVNQGVPEIWRNIGAKDSRATRVGAGGKFTKGLFNLYRSQAMPFSSSLLLKNSAQISNHTLLASEEFQIGGPYSVRGYPSAEYAGDKGLYSSAEWSFPYYFIPKTFNLPICKTNLYDASRFVIFYDWATTRINRPQSSDSKRRTLKSLGFGLRFNFKYVSAKAEFAYPIHGPKSSDVGRQHMQPWLELSAEF